MIEITLAHASHIIHMHPADAAVLTATIIAALVVALVAKGKLK